MKRLSHNLFVGTTLSLAALLSACGGSSSTPAPPANTGTPTALATYTLAGTTSDFPASQKITFECGDTVTLDSSNSTDSDGTIEKREWSLTYNGSSNSSTSQTRLYPSVDNTSVEVTGHQHGTYFVALTVTDDSNKTDQYHMALEIEAPAAGTLLCTINTPPIASINAKKIAYPGSATTLSASSSYDPQHAAGSFDSPIDGYTWTITDKPTGSTATLSSTTTASTLFQPDLRGDYTFSLIVTSTHNPDPQETSSPATFTITANSENVYTNNFNISALPTELTSSIIQTPTGLSSNATIGSPLGSPTLDDNYLLLQVDGVTTPTNNQSHQVSLSVDLTNTAPASYASILDNLPADSKLVISLNVQNKDGHTNACIPLCDNGFSIGLFNVANPLAPTAFGYQLTGGEHSTAREMRLSKIANANSGEGTINDTLAITTLGLLASTNATPSDPLSQPNNIYGSLRIEYSQADDSWKVIFNSNTKSFLDPELASNEVISVQNSDFTDSALQYLVLSAKNPNFVIFDNLSVRVELPQP